MTIDTTRLTHAERQVRMSVRNFLLTANRAELEAELRLSEERGDTFRAACVRELMDDE